MKHLIQRLLGWLAAEDTGALDRHLARACNAADVEQRLRQWDSRHCGGIHLS